MKMSKRARQQHLIQAFQEGPFLTDDEMAKRCGVSIQTIRLDRMELGIPELRERIKLMAENNFDEVRSLALEEVIGEVVELELDEYAKSVLEIRSEHVFERTQIARGHYLFAQANSLAVAVANAEIALTRSAAVRFLRPVRLGEKCIAEAKVEQTEPSRIQVEVHTRVQDDLVFQGLFDVYFTTEDEWLVKEDSP